MTEEQKKFYDIKHTRDYKTVGEDIDYKVFTDHDRKEIVIQFEESDSRTDWRHNLACLPWPLKIADKVVWTTHGYACAYASAGEEPIKDFLNATIDNPGYKLCIRGWSFGSAMAKIMARHLQIMGVPIDELTTYGDVKCWLNPFYKAPNVKRIREYTTANDGITWCVPLFHREKKCKVGRNFNPFEILNTKFYHTHYEEYDYSQWETKE